MGYTDFATVEREWDTLILQQWRGNRNPFTWEENIIAS